MDEPRPRDPRDALQAIGDQLDRQALGEAVGLAVDAGELLAQARDAGGIQREPSKGDGQLVQLTDVAQVDPRLELDLVPRDVLGGEGLERPGPEARR